MDHDEKSCVVLDAGSYGAIAHDGQPYTEVSLPDRNKRSPSRIVFDDIL